MDWRASAACLDADPEQFFPLTDSGPSVRQVECARVVCGSCKVRAECLEWALANDIRHGVWGGVTEQERHAIQARTRRLTTAG